ncbi:WD-40 repeat protein [Reticulomyxa filosa]|uniref:WD-40 repeat protein n=1 Tax=Reticulomyxa filosa TaxID=46433 RepID=X6M2D9_RETFI|nr:WD-40 repeat protein [Reticulomyxa filosa]|eukprot:ETO07746.1 WD-40 repeat protein [Reticulomyxa filosa]
MYFVTENSLMKIFSLLPNTGLDRLTFHLDGIMIYAILLLNIKLNKLLNTLTGSNCIVWSIDYLASNGVQFICSGSGDKSVRVWDLKTNEQIRCFNEHSATVFCVKFSQHHKINLNRDVICSSSQDKTIRFWDVDNNKQLKILNGHNGGVFCIGFSPLEGGRYLFSGSSDNTIRVWNVQRANLLYTYTGHTNIVRCLDCSPVQTNSGSGYIICSGSNDKTVRAWDIETGRQFMAFHGHSEGITSVKFGSNELGYYGGSNLIISGALDKIIRLWDIRHQKHIGSFYGHNCAIYDIEFSPFIINNNDICCNSNVICSASHDNTLRFWDLRSCSKELYVHRGDKDDNGILITIYVYQQKKDNFVFGDKFKFVFVKCPIFQFISKYLFLILLLINMFDFSFRRALKINVQNKTKK